jgi:hypothetical protein
VDSGAWGGFCKYPSESDNFSQKRRDASKLKIQSKLQWLHGEMEQMRVGMHSRREILKATFEEYQRASKKGRQELLDRLTPVTGLNRSYLVTALSTYGRNKEAAKPGAKGRRKARPEGKRGGRPVKYGEGFVKVPGAIWEDYGKPCGKLLVPMISGMIDYLVESEEPN